MINKDYSRSDFLNPVSKTEKQRVEIIKHFFENIGQKLNNTINLYKQNKTFPENQKLEELLWKIHDETEFCMALNSFFDKFFEDQLKLIDQRIKTLDDRIKKAPIPDKKTGDNKYIVFGGSDDRNYLTDEKDRLNGKREIVVNERADFGAIVTVKATELWNNLHNKKQYRKE